MNTEEIDWKAPILEPKIVSSWLGLPGTQLPRETMKIIGQPAQPSQKQGGSARYSIQDAVLMKLGRTLTELGVTPHRVRMCVDEVRRAYLRVLAGHTVLGPGQPWQKILKDGPFYLVGRQVQGAFFVVITSEHELTHYLTEVGLEGMNMAREEMRHELNYWKQTDPDRYQKLLNRRKPSDIEPVDAGSPAIVQNVTRFVQDQQERLLKHMEEKKGERKTR